MSTGYQGGAHRIDSLYGDIFPSNFSYHDPLLDQDLLKLWNRNEFVQLLIDWMPFEAFRRWVKFIVDEGNVNSFKFGKPYVFSGYEYVDKDSGKTYRLTGFEEYCIWNKVMQEFIFGVSLSRIYPEGALLVFLDDDGKNIMPSNDKGGKAFINWKKNKDPQGYSSFIAYQPIEVGTGTGFSVYKTDDNGNITHWKLKIHSSTMRKAKTFIIEADRCIHLKWKKRENDWNATSRVVGMARIAQLETQIFEKLTKRAHDIAGGILKIIGCASKEEQETLDNAIGSDLTSVDRIYLQEGRDIVYETPDLKAAGEFATIFEMFSKKLCRHMRVSQLILDGEHTGAGLGGNNNIELMNSYSEIYQIQEHYRTDLENVFYKLGKENTTFIYNEILPEEMTVKDELIGDENDAEYGSDTRKIKEKDNKEEDGQKNN